MIDELPAAWFTAYSSFQAEVGLKLIEKVKRENETRIKNVEYIKENVASMKFPELVAGAKNIYWQFVIYFDEPFEAQSVFIGEKVDTSTTSLVLISSLTEYPYQGDTPNARRLFDNGLFIPSYPGLSMQDIDRVCMTIDKANGLR